MSSQALLHALARNLRRLREEAGLSVSELARTAGLSRRYVSETEAGRGNPSLLTLAALARALEVPVTRLVEVGPGAYRGGRVALVGLRGAGKSTLGRRLARELEAPFVELDARVEQAAGLSLAQIFDLHGAETFHRFEREALEQVLSEGDRLVLATGGSIVDSEENFARLCETCHTVWLQAEPTDHYERVLAQGDRRPMRGRPRAMEELRALLERRRPAYERCDLHLSTAGTDVDGAAEELERLLRERVDVSA